MNTATKKQVHFIKSLMAKNKLLEQSADFAIQYSDGRTEHISELTTKEAFALIKSLYNPDPEMMDRFNAMRRKIISNAYEMGWVKVVVAGGKQELKADMDRIDQWCLQYGVIKKTLNKYTFAELSKIVTQFGKVHSDFLKQLK